MKYTFRREERQMWKRIAMVMFVLTIFAVACKSLTSPDENNTVVLEVAGTVTNAKNGVPIADALIEVTHYVWDQGFEPVQSTRTDGDGRYSIRISVGKGSHDSSGWVYYDLRASAKGYQAMLFKDYYPIQYTTEVQIANFQLEPL
jgi:hypothetical protein